MNLFVEQPNLEMKVGISVTKNTDLEYSNEHVTQTIKNLQLETAARQKGTNNGINAYESQSYIRLSLNEGDVLLFDKDRGYYMPRYPYSKIDDAISDIESLKEFASMEVDVEELIKEGNEDDTAPDEKEDTTAN